MRLAVAVAKTQRDVLGTQGGGNGAAGRHDPCSAWEVRASEGDDAVTAWLQWHEDGSMRWAHGHVWLSGVDQSGAARMLVRNVVSAQ